ncbi:hypothetical protein Ddc_00546 [Ditylenchus destructor]|nr:hypothetical protein Ddc_00546 [Ditylenchus destructor]
MPNGKAYIWVDFDILFWILGIPNTFEIVVTFIGCPFSLSLCSPNRTEGAEIVDGGCKIVPPTHLTNCSTACLALLADCRQITKAESKLLTIIRCGFQEGMAMIDPSYPDLN